jgi:predicted 2-oxoglutarate/Fe(II)-dependent dioxygenase YbiX
MNYPFVKPKFLSNSMVSRYADYLGNTCSWEENDHPVWTSRSINLPNVDATIREELLDLRQQVKHEISNQFNTQRDLFCDIFQFVRWRTGDVLHPHADAEHPDGSIHPYQYRQFATIIYLNESYSGGQIYFPNANNYEPAMAPGTLVIFPGTLDFLHGVKQITSGTRYTIAGFFTYDKQHHDGYRI